MIDELVNDNALGFVVVKLALVGLGSWLLWSRRRSPLAVVGIFSAFIAYYVILVHHVGYVSTLVGNTYFR